MPKHESIAAVDYSYQTTQNGYRYEAVLDVGLSPEQVEQALIAPIAAATGRVYTTGDLQFGLQEYRPNGLVSKNATAKGRAVRSGLRQMLPDIHNLYNFLDEAQATEECSAEVRMAADTHQVTNYARERLVTMTAADLLRLSTDAGVQLDEFDVFAIKGFEGEEREIRLYDIEDIGGDSEKLRRHLAGKLFKQIDFLRQGGVEIGLVLEEDLPVAPPWMKHVQVGSLQQPLPAIDSLPRWEVRFREGVVAHRRVVPVMSWASVGRDAHLYEPPYELMRKRLDFNGSRVQFDPDTRTLTHFSPILGAIMLAGQTGLAERVELRNVHTFFGDTYDSHGANRHRHTKKLLVPKTGVAAMPAIIAAYGQAMLTSESFKAIEAEAPKQGGNYLHWVHSRYGGQSTFATFLDILRAGKPDDWPLSYRKDFYKAVRSQFRMRSSRP